MVACRESTPFDIWHPAVPFGYFAAVIVMSMSVFQPVFVIVSLLGSIACGVVVRGRWATARDLRWQLPLIALIALMNPLFATMGTTPLFAIFGFTMYAESLAYGACMGAMLASLILWFQNAAAVLSSSKVMALFGNAAPTLSLMLSMIARLTPLFARRGRDIAEVDKACTAGGRASASTLGAATRRSTVLMSWSMEDSLEEADAMRARGYGALVRRTTYAGYRFRAFDGIALVVLIALVILCAFLAWTAASQFAFYPTMPTLRIWWGYVPYAVLVFTPVIAKMGEVLRWMR